MSDVADYTIQREIVIDAPADVVWRTITEPDQIAQWFADEVELDLQPGGHGTFVFTDRARNHPTTAPLVVETVDAPRRFAFRWSHPADELPVEGNSALVTFTLHDEGPERTRLRVVETGVEALGWPEPEKAKYVDEHNGGWAVHLDRLGTLFPAATSS